MIYYGEDNEDDLVMGDLDEACYCDPFSDVPCGWCRREFADPGGESALRAGVRNHPCPTCGEEDRLTSKDVSLGYQCDVCASRLEGTYRGGDY